MASLENNLEAFPHGKGRFCSWWSLLSVHFGEGSSPGQPRRCPAAQGAHAHTRDARCTSVCACGRRPVPTARPGALWDVSLSDSHGNPPGPRDGLSQTCPLSCPPGGQHPSTVWPARTQCDARRHARLTRTPSARVSSATAFCKRLCRFHGFSCSQCRGRHGQRQFTNGRPCPAAPSFRIKSGSAPRRSCPTEDQDEGYPLCAHAPGQGPPAHRPGTRESTITLRIT